MANANRHSSLTDRWATPFTRLKWETSFGMMLKPRRPSGKQALAFFSISSSVHCRKFSTMIPLFLEKAGRPVPPAAMLFSWKQLSQYFA
ncbi:hypothetical protein ETC03_10960 [Geobacillus sp. MMMUD3]|nr:hypothetical protein [Geobacillus sp. MMMUD3]